MIKFPSNQPADSWNLFLRFYMPNGAFPVYIYAVTWDGKNYHYHYRLATPSLNPSYYGNLFLNIGSDELISVTVRSGTFGLPVGLSQCSIFLCPDPEAFNVANVCLAVGNLGFLNPVCWALGAMTSDPHLNDCPYVASPSDATADHFDYSIPFRGNWILESAFFDLVAHAAGGNHFCKFEVFDSSGNQIYAKQSGVALAAGSTYECCFSSIGEADSLAASVLNCNISEIPLAYGYTLRFGGNGFAANDQFVDISLLFKVCVVA